MPTIITTLATYAAFVIAGLIVALNGLAPLTKTDWDNRALKALVWFHDTVLAFLLPQHTVMVKAKADPAPEQK
jgi:hypothetical protein